MSKYLFYERFKWLKNVDIFDVNLISKKSPIGYIVKVDLEYPDELHALHYDYPLASAKLAIPYDMLSDYCQKNADEYGINVGDLKKLISNLSKLIMYFIREIFSFIYL